jgi:hypothetical protein
MTARSRKRLVITAVLLAIVAVIAVVFAITCAPLRTRTPPISNQVVAPDFELPDQNDRLISLAWLTARGPAVIVFYRGYW